MSSLKLANEQSTETNDREGGEDHDEMRTEPVLLLAFIQHDLQRPHTNYEQADSPVVDAGTLSPQVRWVVDECLRQQNSQNADWNIDVEDPAPTVVIGEPTAEDGPEHRRDHDSKCPKCHCLPTLLGWEGLKKNGLRERL